MSACCVEVQLGRPTGASPGRVERHAVGRETKLVVGGRQCEQRWGVNRHRCRDRSEKPEVDRADEGRATGRLVVVGNRRGDGSAAPWLPFPVGRAVRNARRRPFSIIEDRYGGDPDAFSQPPVQPPSGRANVTCTCPVPAEFS